VAEWCKSISTSGGTLLEKWNDAMSPLSKPLFGNYTDRRSDSRVNLYKSIVKKAEEYREKLVDGTMGSSGFQPGRKWDWDDEELVCIHTVKLTHFALLMVFI
jgi:hypothetical protein